MKKFNLELIKKLDKNRCILYYPSFDKFYLHDKACHDFTVLKHDKRLRKMMKSYTWIKKRCIR